MVMVRGVGFRAGFGLGLGLGLYLEFFRVPHNWHQTVGPKDRLRQSDVRQCAVTNLR
jgi:hypothetical protein